MAGELKVVIVDDDEWKRSAMASRLDATAEVEIVEALDQDTAATWVLDRWKEIDRVLVDVFDDRAPGEVGTDLYSGITVVERVQRLPVRCIAVTPSCAHPLVHLRLQQAHPDYCYHRFQLATIEALTEAVRYPEREHRLPELEADKVKRLGARKLLANDAVRTYVGSPLYGKLRANLLLKELKALGVERRAVDNFCDEIVADGFNFGETLTEEQREDRDPLEPPRWPVVRELMLKLLGRLDAPWSEFDKPWWPEAV